MKLIKPKLCKICHAEFIPRSTTQKVCDWQCAIKLGQEKAAKKASKESFKARKNLRDNDKSFQNKKAQQIFNKWVRLRDEDKN